MNCCRSLLPCVAINIRATERRCAAPGSAGSGTTSATVPAGAPRVGDRTSMSAAACPVTGARSWWLCFFSTFSSAGVGATSRWAFTFSSVTVGAATPSLLIAAPRTSHRKPTSTSFNTDSAVDGSCRRGGGSISADRTSTSATRAGAATSASGGTFGAGSCCGGGGSISAAHTSTSATRAEAATSASGGTFGAGSCCGGGGSSSQSASPGSSSRAGRVVARDRSVIGRGAGASAASTTPSASAHVAISPSLPAASRGGGRPTAASWAPPPGRDGGARSGGNGGGSFVGAAPGSKLSSSHRLRGAGARAAAGDAFSQLTSVGIRRVTTTMP